jgi:hypothetical protein
LYISTVELLQSVQIRRWRVTVEKASFLFLAQQHLDRSAAFFEHPNLVIDQQEQQSASHSQQVMLQLLLLPEVLAP